MSFNVSNVTNLAPNPSIYCSDRAEDYDKYRPIHPAAAINVILSGLGSPAQLVAADIGTGIGTGARFLADSGLRVFAIESNEDMRIAATSHEGVEFLVGTAEQIPLETASVDLVTSFQAFHWFNFDQSLQEFGRILKPDGRLAMIWSVWDQRDVVSKLYTHLIFEAFHAQKQPAQSLLQPEMWLIHLRYLLFLQGIWLPYFTHFQRHEFMFSQHLDLAGLIGLARGQGFTPLGGAVLDKIVSDLSVFHSHFCDAQGQVQLRYYTRLHTATLARRHL